MHLKGFGQINQILDMKKALFALFLYSIKTNVNYEFTASFNAFPGLNAGILAAAI